MVKAGLQPLPPGDRFSAQHLTPINLLDAWGNPDHPFHSEAQAVVTQVNSYMQVRIHHRVQG